MFFGGFPFDDHPGMGGPRGPKKEVDTQKFYDALDLPKECSTSDIKKAYRKCAIKHHPDKGGDIEKFKEISRAYEVLVDPEKRKIYDEVGEEGLDGPDSAGDPTDIFDLFFGGGGRRGPPRGKKKGEDVVTHIVVTLEQIYNGATRRMAINRDIICQGCDGRGGPQEAVESCSPCGGHGVKVQIRQMGPMIQQTQSVCPSCKGQGKSIPDHKKCKKCTGGGTVKERKILDVFIDKGVPPNHKIVFRGEADQKPDEIAGDVVFMVDQQEHTVFKRRGHDLFLTKKISLYEALTGFKFVVDHLDGRKLLLESAPGEVTRPESVRAVRDEGMPRPKNPFLKGNLFIVFAVEFPTDADMDDQKRHKLKDILPLPKPLKVNEKDPNLERYVVQEIDPDEVRQGGSSKEAYDDDDDEEGQGGNPRVQCRQQ